MYVDQIIGRCLGRVKINRDFKHGQEPSTHNRESSRPEVGRYIINKHANKHADEQKKREEKKWMDVRKKPKFNLFF